MATNTMDSQTHRTEKKIGRGWGIGLVVAILLAIGIFMGIKGMSNRGDMVEPHNGVAPVPAEETPIQPDASGQPTDSTTTQPETTN